MDEKILKWLSGHDRAIHTHKNDIRRLADAIIQLQAKVNTMEAKIRKMEGNING